MISGRTVEDIAAGKPARAEEEVATKQAAKTARARSCPGFIPPALATLKPSPPRGAAWVHEIKFDGYRLEAQVRNGKARLLTRSGQDWTDRFGAGVAEALAALPVRTAILDGELVVEGSGGASDFSALQADLGAGRSDRFRYYLFDLLYLDGEDLRSRPLVDRKERLAALLRGRARAAAAQRAFRARTARSCCGTPAGSASRGWCRSGGCDAYPTGPHQVWIKSKCSARQEFVIAGYVPSTVSRDLVGSLVLGYYRDGELVHVGRVGTGFSRATAEDLAARLKPLRAQDPAVRREAERRRGARSGLGEARAGRRGRVPGLDRRRHPAPRRLPRPARGQAGARGRPRGRRGRGRSRSRGRR